MTKYSDIITNVPQNEAVFGKNQVKNNAGGYVFTISDWDRLNRFLILGSEKNSYYVKGSVLSKENAENVLNLIEQDGCRVVDETVKISDAGRAPKNDPAIFVMALASAFGNADVKAYAFRNLNKVCRTATHLFQFVEDVQKFRGWGRGLRKAIANWYLDKNTSQLVYQVIKYKNREGWTHKDTISLSHPVAVNDDTAYIFNKIVKGYDENAMVIGEAPMMKDLEDVTNIDLQSVNTVSMAAIFIIIMIIFKSISLPIILVAVIEFAIAVNMAVPFYQNISLPFVASIVVGTIQLGATVDYAILMTSRYQKERSRGKNKKEAVSAAHKASIESIITSGLSFFAATFGVSAYSKVDMIGSICTLLSRGALISVVVVALVLPAMFLIFDKVICKTSINFLGKK